MKRAQSRSAKDKRPKLSLQLPLQARREWHNIFKIMKGNNQQPRILYLARLSFRLDGAIKSFPESKSEENSAKPY